MSRFAHSLRQARENLRIPQPARSRLLLELAADMEALFEHYRQEGLDEREAEARTRESFDLSPEALRQLADVHSPPVGRFLDHLSQQARGRWERGALALVLTPIVLLGIRLVRGGDLLRDAGPVVWPMLLVAFLVVGLGLIKFHQIYLKKDHDIRRLRRGLDGPLRLAGVQLALGFGGMYGDLIRVYLQSRAEKALTIPYLAHWLLRNAALLSVAMMAALLGGLVWYLLARRVAGIERSEAALLLGRREI